MAEETASRGRDKFVDKGVIANGDGTYRGNDVEVTPYQYWTTNYSSKITEANVFDATFIKLREIVLNYSLPKKWFRNTSIGQLSLGIEAPQPVAHQIERSAHRPRSQHLRSFVGRFGRRVCSHSFDPQSGFQH